MCLAACYPELLLKVVFFTTTKRGQASTRTLVISHSGTLTQDLEILATAHRLYEGARVSGELIDALVVV